MAVKFQELFKNPSFQKTFEYMGHNPDSAVAVAVAIAVFKGIFRPIFTLTDKKSDPETKKYTAIREGLTEGIAAPVYILVPMIAKKLIVENFYKNTDEIMKKAITANVKFIAVLASTAIIPAVCNIVQPPIMAAFKRSQKTKKELAKPSETTVVNKPSFSGRTTIKSYNKVNYGMRVGN